MTDSHRLEPVWQQAHERANADGLDGYFDPATGLFVMTAGYLERRGTCCASHCRHCPYRSDAPDTAAG